MNKLKNFCKINSIVQKIIFEEIIDILSNIWNFNKNKKNLIFKINKIYLTMYKNILKKDNNNKVTNNNN